MAAASGKVRGPWGWTGDHGQSPRPEGPQSTSHSCGVGPRKTHCLVGPGPAPSAALPRVTGSDLDLGAGTRGVFPPLPGHANASFCPHGYGCRALVLCEGQAVLDVTDSELTVTVRVPEGRWLWLVSPGPVRPSVCHTTVVP